MLLSNIPQVKATLNDLTFAKAKFVSVLNVSPSLRAYIKN